MTLDLTGPATEQRSRPRSELDDRTAPAAVTGDLGKALTLLVLLCVGLTGCASGPSGPAEREDYYNQYRDRCLGAGINKPPYCDR